ncbi:MAG: sensor histidine kinase, partial [Chloroflexota bacterium]
CQVSIDEISQADGAGHRLTFVNRAQTEIVKIDEVLVSRILFNLLSNAVKYSPEGSEIRLELDQVGQHLRLRVIDRGMGISPADQARIFEPFYRASSALRFEGTGLGLSIVQDCVKRHRGNIRVQSTASRGTVFTVELPIASAIAVG